MSLAKSEPGGNNVPQVQHSKDSTVPTDVLLLINMGSAVIGQAVVVSQCLIIF